MTALASDKKPDGRSREARAARAAPAQAPTLSIDGDDDARAAAPPQRQATRQSVRSATREPARAPTRNGVEGRDGEILSRKRASGADIFDIPLALIPVGWEYQWVAISVHGDTELVEDQNLLMAENGWRPVPHSRHASRFKEGKGADGKGGCIIRGKQMLMERPKSMCDEARAEEVMIAKRLISDRNDALMLNGVKKSMPSGFDMNRKYRGTGGNVKMSIDPALDIEAPGYTLAESGE